MITSESSTEDIGIDGHEKLVYAHGVRLPTQTEHLLNRMALIAEHHSGGDLHHIRRVSLFTHRIALELGLDEKTAMTISAAARLHEIGMIGVPSSILRKPGRLTPAEMAVIRKHPKTGLRLIGRKQDPLIRAARAIIGAHHERWDGSGYPDGLKQDSIPFEARIVAIADTFDSLCSPRPYRRATDPEMALTVITNAGTGGIFDADMLGAFFKGRKAILDICHHLPHR